MSTRNVDDTQACTEGERVKKGEAGCVVCCESAYQGDVIMRLVRLDQGMFNMSLGEKTVESSPRDLSSHQGTVALGDARVWMGANEGVVARGDTSDRLLAMFVEAYFFSSKNDE